MARAAAFQADGPGFESLFPHHVGVAQLVEHLLAKQEAVGSGPTAHTTWGSGGIGRRSGVKSRGFGVRVRVPRPLPDEV